MIEFQRQSTVVDTVRALREENPQRGLDWALGRVRVSRATFFRYEANVKAGTACVKDRAPGGRPRKFQLSEGEIHKLRSLVAIHDSVDFAVEKFVDCRECTHNTRVLLLDAMELAARRGTRPRWPESLHRAARLTQAEKAELRGEKHAGNVALAPRIGLFRRDENGVDHHIKAHSTWSFDDESINRPYLVPINVHPNFRDQVDPRYHWKLARQFLKSMDIYSEAWLGVMAVGRRADQYRGEDIVRFMYEVVMAQGTLPDRVILERGRWEGTAIHGISVFNGHREVMWGGLDDLFTIDHKKDSRGKAWLETGLRLTQRATAFIGEDIGGKRGEFELANKHWAQIQRQAAMLEEGKELPKVLRDPLAVGFLTQEQAEEIEAQACFEVNCRAKVREAFGRRAVVPNDLLQNAITPRPLPESERWRFFPIKKEAAVIKGGLIQVAVQGYDSFQFVVNGVDPHLHLDNGYRVLIAFDPQRPDFGCYVANAETGSKNRNHFGFGELILMAPYQGPLPLSDDSETHGPDYKRRARATVRSGFAQVKKHITDTRAARIHQTLDEHGRTTRTSNRPEMTPARSAESPRRHRAAAPAIDMDALRRKEAAAMGEEVVS